MADLLGEVKYLSIEILVFFNVKVVEFTFLVFFFLNYNRDIFLN